jgi:hypothetical protein
MTLRDNHSSLALASVVSTITPDTMPPNPPLGIPGYPDYVMLPTKWCTGCKKKWHLWIDCKANPNKRPIESTPGYITRQPPKRQASPGRGKSKSKKKSKLSSKGSKSRSKKQDEESDSSISMVAFLSNLGLSAESNPNDNPSSTINLQQVWGLDSMCSQHMTHSRDIFGDNFKHLTDGKDIRGINGARCTPTGVGDVIIPCVENGKTINITIRNVNYVPGCGVNLISIGQLIDHGVDIDLKSTDSTITVKNHRLSVSLRNKCFFLDSE